MSDLLRKAKKALLLARTPRYRRALLQGTGAAIEHRALSSLDPALVVDVGANKGQFTLLALELFPQARIVAFEPLRAAGERFGRAVGVEPRVRLVPAALGLTAGEADMHVSGRDDCSSLLDIAGLQELVPGAAMVGTEKVRIGRLEDFLGEDDFTGPALLKIDVQGFELQVLQGCGDWLKRFAWVYVELSFCELYAGQALADPVIRHLLAAGFSFTAVYNLSCDAAGRPLQADILFSRSA